MAGRRASDGKTEVFSCRSRESSRTNVVELSPIPGGDESLLGERPQPCGQEANTDEPKLN